MGIKDSEIAGLKVGDIVYECERGLNIETRILSVPVVSHHDDGRRKWQWTAENTQTGEEIFYMLTEGLSHHGPRLYREPQYMRIENGEASFPLVGEK